jgi:hypothetical protein
MLAWCTILFVLGVLAFLDSLFSYGEIFRRANSLLFMCVSLGLLARTYSKVRTEKKRAKKSGYRPQVGASTESSREESGVAV